MPTLLTENYAIPQPLLPSPKRWSREECEAIETLGILENQNFELIDGELFSKMGKKRPHVISQSAMQIWLAKVFGLEFLNSEGPIDVSPQDNPTNEPQPDLIVLKQNQMSYRSGNPRPEDIRLLVEISDSSLRFDLTRKARLYARAGIVEYWVLDIEGRKLYCHREPAGDSYSSIVLYSENEPVSPLAAPEAQFVPASVLIKP